MTPYIKACLALNLNPALEFTREEQQRLVLELNREALFRGTVSVHTPGRSFIVPAETCLDFAASLRTASGIVTLWFDDSPGGAYCGWGW